MNRLQAWLRQSGSGPVLLLALLLVVVLPLSLDIFRLNLVGKYLSYAFVAIGLVMVWGYGGVLSLGQGVFFGLGGYSMALYLKLEEAGPGRVPDFMSWSGVEHLPLVWEP
ncbi:MAG TPA: urea ABC transporter permease subunit UrtC, partial [Albitalea sp.]|nr:urea ABC transporter permease subunit UrtC [Albitalea sp.]